jgi:hypothetical protein
MRAKSEFQFNGSTIKRFTGSTLQSARRTAGRIRRGGLFNFSTLQPFNHLTSDFLLP